MSFFFQAGAGSFVFSHRRIYSIFAGIPARTDSQSVQVRADAPAPAPPPRPARQDVCYLYYSPSGPGRNDVDFCRAVKSAISPPLNGAQVLLGFCISPPPPHHTTPPTLAFRLMMFLLFEELTTAHFLESISEWIKKFLFKWLFRSAHISATLCNKRRNSILKVLQSTGIPLSAQWPPPPLHE